MNILITGGGGFLGGYIVEQLLAQKFSVHSLSRNLYPHLADLDVHQIQCDLSQFSAVNQLNLSHYDAIIHTAALAGIWGDKKKFWNINYHGALNLAKKARTDGVKYFIYTSSPSVVFGRDHLENVNESTPYPEGYYTDYAHSKAQAEKEILAMSGEDFQTCALRPHLIWGPGDPHLIPRVVEKAKAGQLKVVGNGDNLVDIIYVENAATAHVELLLALKDGKKLGGNAYFIGQEKPVVLWDFINDILDHNNLGPVTDYISFNLAYVLGGLFEFVYKTLGILKPEPPMTRFVSLQLAKSHYFSHAKAQSDFGYTPKIKIEEGLERTFASSKKLKSQIETFHQSSE